VTVTGTSHFSQKFNGTIQKGETMTTSEPFEFARYKRPQFERPVHKRAHAAESDDDQMPPENLSALLGRVSENSTCEIDSLIREFERLRRKLQTDGERIQREIEEYTVLSQQVMQLTEAISESVEKVRASVD
jgi:methyl-accepting chemotaxis protein